MSPHPHGAVAALASWVACVLTGLVGPVLAQTPTFEEVRTLTRGPEPVVREVEVAAAGTYRLTLTDLAVPTAFSSLQVAVTRGDTMVASLAAPGSVDVTVATAGRHVLRVVGVPATSARAGSFGLRLVNPSANDAVVTEFAAAIDSPPADVAPTRRTIDTTFEVTAAGSYQVTLTDHALPATLSTLTLAILRDGGTAIDAQLAAAGSVNFMATTGRYRLIVIAETADANGGGVFGVRVRNVASQSLLYAQSEEVGAVRELSLADPLQAGAHELQLSDLSFPAPLTASRVLLTSDAAVVARRDAPGIAAFTATAGAHQLFALATATAVVPGSFGVELRRGAGVVYSTVLTAPATDTTATIRAYNYLVDIPSAGNYRLRLTDFEFPQALTGKGIGAVQSGVLLGSLTAPGILDLANVAAGRLHVVALATPAPGTPAGLFGIDLVPSGSTTPVFEKTESIGTLFFGRNVSITNAGDYQVNINDLRFPAQFGELAAVVTRGAERLGSVFAGGTFSFTATPGNYTLSVVAQPGATAVYGTYALRVSPRPPAPVLTFAADNTTVDNGGTAMLTWSATHATACTASGGWAGTKAMTGSERTAVITVSTTYTLNCDGPGGQRSNSVTITPRAASNPGSSGGGGGGGGRIDAILLVMLGLALVAARLAHRGRRALKLPATLLAGGIAGSLLANPAVAEEVLARSLPAAAVVGNPARNTEAPRAAEDAGYRVQPGDVLVVAVWKERDLQGEILVRPDGGISFPLAGDLAAGGRTAIQLAGDLADRLKRYIPDPVVTVAVKSIGGNRVYVLGKVNRPGEFAFSQPLDVMQALAMAGGATSFAAVNDIRILRRTGNRLEAVEFHYGDVERGRKLEQNIVLRSGDTVVVP